MTGKDRRSPAITRRLAVQRLRAALIDASPRGLDDHGYCRSPADNLVEGVALDDIAAEFAAGAGAELATKFRAPHSSSALAVNTFAALRRQQTPLPLAGADVRVSGFEVKRPTGLPRAQPPHLDVLAVSASRVLAIESKCLEPLTPKAATFSSRYRDVPTRGHRASRWFAEMERIMSGAEPSYRHLDAAQLIKHAFGLAACADHRSITLLYLYWEPTDAADWPVFAAHRAEIAAFAELVKGDAVAFASLTYPELWDDWLASGDPVLRQAAAAAVPRYRIALDCTPRPHPV